MKRKPLGRGLESLIPRKSSDISKSTSDNKLLEINIADIIPNDEQPRHDFDPDALSALTESIKQRGIMQPLAVTSDKSSNKYMLISGERRWRAAGLAGLKVVPAVLIETPDKDVRLELALIENTQRDDLKPLELAQAYKALMQRCSYRQEDVARIAGKSRSAVANTLRLLDLQSDVMDALEHRFITEGHARVFLTLDSDNNSKLLNMVLNSNLSVRETEELARSMHRTDLAKETKKQVEFDPNTEAIREEIEEFFGSKVKMKNSAKGGTIEIKYESLDDLDRIINKLRGELC